MALTGGDVANSGKKIWFFRCACGAWASLWLRAVLAIAVCAGLGILLARLAGGKNKR
ncbi:hypothetical protein RBH76_14145 [Oscillospiraceae bacterium MB24-C1]|nr:hypothetical protein RBH76_14145 [Oscillospiraceae bacterium MB24-C1]